jgi:hypothetical protein
MRCKCDHDIKLGKSPKTLPHAHFSFLLFNEYKGGVNVRNYNYCAEDPDTMSGISAAHWETLDRIAENS